MTLSPQDEAVLDILDEASKLYEQYLELSEAAAWRTLLNPETELEEQEAATFATPPIGLVVD